MMEKEVKVSDQHVWVGIEDRHWHRLKSDADSLASQRRLRSTTDPDAKSSVGREVRRVYPSLQMLADERRC